MWEQLYLILEQLAIILMVIISIVGLHHYIKAKLKNKQINKFSLVKFIFCFLATSAFVNVLIVYVVGNLVSAEGIYHTINAGLAIMMAQGIFLIICLVGTVRELLGKKNSRAFSIIYGLTFFIFIGSFLAHL